jgi:hypothetical protein
MRDDDLDRILTRDDAIVPSSGFVSSVMDAVMRETATPPAIPFPWKRAIPGLGAWALMLAVCVVTMFRFAESPSGSSISPAITGLLEAAGSFGAGWIVLALLVSFVSVKISMRLTGASK